MYTILVGVCKDEISDKDAEIVCEVHSYIRLNRWQVSEV